MDEKKVLIVEDEAIVAEDLKSMLQRMGYGVVGIASTGAEALALVESQKPNMVLMDIRIKGDMDGIDTAENIVVQYDIPVTYLTAYADDQTLERAKTTLPYGYILKPFEERDLRATIEMALYKHRMQTLLEKVNNWHAMALRSLSVGVLAVDPQEKVTFMNPVAESLVGQKLESLMGKSLTEFFPAAKAGSSSGRGEVTLPDGTKTIITFREAPMKDEIQSIVGRVITFQKA